MTVLLREVGRNVEREVEYELRFHGVVIGRYRADMVVERKVIVEVKAARAIDSSHRAQLRNYLKASGLSVGLVVNFGERATFRRVVLTPKEASKPSSRALSSKKQLHRAEFTE